MNNINNFYYKLSKSVIPMLFVCLSIGWCYAWSLFKQPIANQIGMSEITVQFTFCLNILFLGLGAAFFGNLVERKIKTSAILSTILFCSGFISTWFGLHFHNILLIYLGSGFLCGLAQGIGYVLSPKNLILWWNKTKYKATIMSLSIICFGLGSSICSVLFNAFFPKYGIENTFLILCVIYTSFMTIGTFLINKPKSEIDKIKNSLEKFNYKKILSNLTFWKYWLFMFLNISAGLILIGNCASILKTSKLDTTAVITVMFICGLANGFGRLIFPIMTDFINKKTTICLLILGIELFVVSPAIFICSLIPFMIILINSTYGAAFSVLPALVSHSFGNKYLSTIHGLILSAWGIASLFAYICTSTLQYFNFNSSISILIVILLMYTVNFFNVYFLKEKKV